MTGIHGIERYLTPRAERDALLPPAEVAEWLHMSVGTLATWRMEKKGPKPQPIGRRIFYRASDVQSWLDEQQEAS